jgi:heat shock protein HslJ
VDWRRKRAGIVGLAAVAACAGLVLYPIGTFPLNRQFQVVSINGREIANSNPTFRATWAFTTSLSIKTWPIETWTSGPSGCNFWSRRVLSLWAGRVVLGSGYHTAIACERRAMQTEDTFDATLAKVTSWRREGAHIILEGGGGTMRLIQRRPLGPDNPPWSHGTNFRHH